MKTTKEYPATHSMSTSWYVVDKDGNLGIFDYNENGPVPWQTEEGCIIDELVFGHLEEKYYKEKFIFNLTTEQILELVEPPISPQEVKDWYIDYTIVRIDKEKENDFLKLCKSKDINEYYCINKENGFYYFDASSSIEEQDISESYCENGIHYYDASDYIEERPIRKNSALQKMIDQKIILEVFELKEFCIDEEYDEKSGKDIPHPQFGNIPYFIFRQQYSTEFLADRLNIPEHPVKISQVPEKFRHRLHKIPKSFYDTKSLQIAQWIPSTISYENRVYYDGCLYNLLPISESENAYCLCKILANDFYPYCPRKSVYNCDKCYTYRECIRIGVNLYTSTPTVVVVKHPKEEISNDKNIKTDIITSNSVIISFFPYFPKRQKDAFWINTKEELQKVSSEAIETVWKQSYHYFESLINEVKPHVIIVTNKGQKLFEKVFKIENHSTEINGVTYPVYLEMEQEQYRAEIEKLAVMPYQGKKHEMVISEEKMNALIEEGKAKHD